MKMMLMASSLRTERRTGILSVDVFGPGAALPPAQLPCPVVAVSPLVAALETLLQPPPFSQPK